MCTQCRSFWLVMIRVICAYGSTKRNTFDFYNRIIRERVNDFMYAILIFPLSLSHTRVHTRTRTYIFSTNFFTFFKFIYLLKMFFYWFDRSYNATCTARSTFIVIERTRSYYPKVLLFLIFVYSFYEGFRIFL